MSSRAPASTRSSGRHLSCTRKSRRPNGTATSASATPARSARAPKRSTRRLIPSLFPARRRSKLRPGDRCAELGDGLLDRHRPADLEALRVVDALRLEEAHELRVGGELRDGLLAEALGDVDDRPD